MVILIMGAGPADPYAEEQHYPVWLAEVDRRLLVERIVDNCAGLAPARLVFAVRESDVRKHHIDKVMTMLSPGAKIVCVARETAGAACTALLAIEYIDAEEELLILNANEVLDVEYARIVESFRTLELDAGVATFSSVHPRYSYVRLDAQGSVVEAAEKRPISRNATCGFYWYRRGADFLEAAQEMIRKDASVNGSYYICPAFNEMVLRHRRIGTYPVPAESYMPLKTLKQMEHMEVADLRLRRAP
jgi:dTDP-glucose pyrophosphorylase